MTRRRLLTGLIAIAASIAVYVFAFGPNDEQRIRYEVTRLGTALSFTEPAQNPLTALGHLTGEVTDLFDEEISIHVPELPRAPTRRADLARTWLEASHGWKSASISFEDVGVKLDDAKRTATVTANAKLDGTTIDGTRHQERRAVNLQFLKRDTSWRITSIHVWPKD